MPSSELTKLIELYDSTDPSVRVEVCQKMWKLKEPEAIPYLALIYAEDDEAKVREAAAESLREFRGLQQELELGGDSKASAGASGKQRSPIVRLLRALLTISLLGLLSLNVVLFVASDDSSADDDTASVDSDLMVVEEVAQTLDDIIRDAEAMKAEIEAVQSNNKSLQEACQRNFIRPTAVEFTAEEQEQYPELYEFATQELGDFAFALLGLNEAFTNWDLACSTDDPSLITNLPGILDGVINDATRGRNAPLLEEQFLLLTPTQPPTNTPLPSITPTENLTEEELLLRQVQASIDEAILTAQGLRNEMQAIEDGSKTQADACENRFSLPQLPALTPEQQTNYPEIAALVNLDSALNVTLNALQGIVQKWNNSYCQNNEVYEPGRIGQLDTLIADLISIRDEQLLPISQ